MKITTINTIEISSVCDNKCEYCPAPLQHKYRKVGFMNREVFERAIDLVKYLCDQGTQRELNLFGVGEPTLHPQVVEFVKHARHKLPFKQDLHLNTNGNTMTLELAKALKDAGITAIDITAHHARAATNTVRIFQAVGMPGRISLDFITQPNNWAGQVDWFKPNYHKIQHEANVCPWLGRGQVMVMSDGNITNCCIDAFAQGVFGTVFDDIAELEIKEMPLCRKCHHLTPGEYEIMRKSYCQAVSA